MNAHDNSNSDNDNDNDSDRNGDTDTIYDADNDFYVIGKSDFV